MKKKILKYILVISSSLLITLGLSCKAEVPVDPSPAIVEKACKTLEQQEFTEENNKVYCNLPRNMKVDGYPVKLKWEITSNPCTHIYKGDLLTVTKDLEDIKLVIKVTVTCNSSSKTISFNRIINKVNKLLIKDKEYFIPIVFTKNTDNTGTIETYAGDVCTKYTYSNLNVIDKTIDIKTDEGKDLPTFSYKIYNKIIDIVTKFNREDWTKSNGLFISDDTKTHCSLVDNSNFININGKTYNVSKITNTSITTTSTSSPSETKEWTVEIPKDKEQIIIKSGEESYTLDFVGYSLSGFSFG